MRCKTCDHSLWNQPVPPEGQPRVCSECGSPYAAADFDYGRGKVRFCCPGCGTGYYGTSPRGHLEPAAFRCVGCGAALTMDRCVIRAHDMDHEGQAMQRVELPWLDPGATDGFRRWWRTTKLGITSAPGLVAALTRPPRPLRAAAFVALSAVIGSSSTVVVVVLGPGVRGGWAGPPGSVVDQVVVGLGIILMVALGTAVFAAIPALFCGLLTRKGEPIGTGRAYEIVAYSSAVFVVGILPCCGAGLGALLWMLATARGFEAALAGEPLGKRVLASLLTIAGFGGTVAAVFLLLSAI